ncbi:MAG: hypothetical protein PUG60_16205 [Lachnospiraceae bacterium]|nr:hypothetical protein [Lachnospiraceae bacterium]MDY4970257.1 hypothetical protein [Lachnospiraceae bacterium]
MRWYDALWIGPGASRQKRRIISSIEKHKPVAGTYFITLAGNPSELLDIVPAGKLSGDAWPAEDSCILGIAVGKQEAFELVEKMVDYIYRETGTLDIRGYFSE